MLGAEKEIIAEYVLSGQVKIVVWPITDIGDRAVNAAAAAYCVGQQDVAAYWRIHDWFYDNYDATYRNDRDFLVDAAVTNGADKGEFEACYDSGEAHTRMLALDQERKDNGITQRPTYDIEGQQTFGVQPFEVFDEFIMTALDS